MASLQTGSWAGCIRQGSWAGALMVHQAGSWAGLL